MLFCSVQYILILWRLNWNINSAKVIWNHWQRSIWLFSDQFPIFSWVQHAVGLKFGTEQVFPQGLSTITLTTCEILVLCLCWLNKGWFKAVWGGVTWYMWHVGCRLETEHHVLDGTNTGDQQGWNQHWWSVGVKPKLVISRGVKPTLVISKGVKPT